MPQTPDARDGPLLEEDELQVIDPNDETRYAILRRQAGNFSITVVGADAKAFYQNARIVQVQLGGLTSSEFFQVSDDTDDPILTAIADGIVKVWRTLEMDTEAGDPPSAGQVRFNGTAFRMRDAAGVFDPRVGSAIFGTEYQEARSPGQQGTTSAAPQTKLTLTTPSLPAGDYIVVGSAEVSGSSTNNRFEAEIRVNGDRIAHVLQRADTAGGGVMLAGVRHLPTISGVQTVDIRWRRQGGFGSSRIEDAQLALWRVA